MENISLDDIYRMILNFAGCWIFAIIICFFQRCINEKFDIKSNGNYKFFSKKMWLKDIDTPLLAGMTTSILSGLSIMLNIEFGLLETVGLALLIFIPLYGSSFIIAKVLYKLYRKHRKTQKI